MTPAEIRKHFPEASPDVLLANAGASRTVSVPRKGKLEGFVGHPNGGFVQSTPIPGIHGAYIPPACSTIRITISGQITGGKNNYIVTRKGKHIPKKFWAKWRDDKVREVVAQLPPGWIPVTVPVDMHLTYVAGDKRRRDNPAIVDALYHVLEKAGVVTDDNLLWPTVSSRSYDPKNPRAEIILKWTP